MKKMKAVLGLAMAMALFSFSSVYAEVAPKKNVPNAKAYERANEKAKFKRTVETKDRTIKTDKKIKEKSSEKKSSEKGKEKKKGFLWWQT